MALRALTGGDVLTTNSLTRPEAETADARPAGPWQKVKGVLTARTMVLFLVNLLIFAILAALRPKAFLDWMNFKAVFSLMVYDLLLAGGMTYVLILGGIDLSVGSVMALVSVVIALSLKSGHMLPLSLALGLATALLCGLFNGIAVARFRIAPFLITLATMSIARGLATVTTTGQYVSFRNPLFIWFGRWQLPFYTGDNAIYSIPVILLVVLAILAVFDLLIKKWRPLNQAFYIGTNREAAALSGIPVNRTIIAGYLICALFCFIAAAFMTANNRIGYANYGIGAEMRAIAAAIVGGCSMAGGSGSLIGTFLGVTMLALIGNGFILLNGSPNWQQAATGVILILAVAADALINRNKRKE